MSESRPPAKSRHGLGRVVDLLAIVVIAVVILWISWTKMQALSMPGVTSATPHSPAIPLDLPLVGNGMLITKDSLRGNHRQALEQLQSQFIPVLNGSRELVLPLEVGTDEQRLLAHCVEAARVSSNEIPAGYAIYLMPQRAGLIAVREAVTSTQNASPSAVTGQRVLCWGFVVADGNNGYSLWFARPAVSLPTASFESRSP